MIDREHFRVLYREFLFRMVDRDLLSFHANGDVSKLLGRVAAFLVWISVPFGALAIAVADGAVMRPVHSVIATTMLIVSILCVLAWDSLLPNRRDVFVLTPLGVQAATIFTARVASLFGALGTAVLVFNAIPGLLFPFALTPPRLNVLQIVFSVHLYRAIVAYWLTVLLSGAFVLLSVVLFQALTELLPRQLALRISSVLQIATFCTAVGIYCLQPSVGTLDQLALSDTQQRLVWLPSYWFLGLFHQLNGMQHGPARDVLVGLAQSALLGLAAVGTCGVLATVTLSARSLRKVAEQPDVVPSRHKRGRSMAFGHSPASAIVQWTIRTLLRSRQHRVLVSFYSGIGVAVLILFLHTHRIQVMHGETNNQDLRSVSTSLICTSFVVLLCWIGGVRAAFSIPIEVRGNWIFQLTLTSGPAEPLTGARASLICAGLLPVWTVTAIGVLWLWPAPKAAQHLLVIALAGTALVAFWLRNFNKIPFASAYLPGASHIHMTMALCVLLGLNLLFWSANLVRQSLFDVGLYLQVVGFLAALAALCWWHLLTRELPPALTYDDATREAILTLGLKRDGYAGT